MVKDSVKTILVISSLVGGLGVVGNFYQTDLDPVHKRMDRLEDKVDRNHEEVINHLLRIIK